MSTEAPVAHKPEGPPRIPGKRAVRPKNAATVMIIRRDAAKPRVLMGKRHGGHSFMPDRWVFPGGRIDRADYRAPFATDLRADVGGLFDRYLPAGRGRALALAAVRETWEEAGLLLAKPAQARATGPWKTFAEQGVLADLDALDVVARAITPPGVGKRFDTWFLLADAERLTSLDRQPDCGELEEIAWVDFDDAMGLPLPTVTRTMIKEAVERMTDPTRRKLFLRYTDKGAKPTSL
ncbi:MAG: NUDIX hydrolase [Alphaproteobacteria bacterium]|nr:NUDIX hydrolase [Alphaproteobacteria bacterium]MBU1512834.1 NUDIX hydrolase [Alphaproteobacteria bacterium]MBU2095730.1 NUDIX hydrolase [Alphaproteobacteria bacterium]MBU2153186.1 NUDIX hydrolase [Alphaproteobacteria bacterium]MBU2309002.1 NUDIX hydrolase [Alphaproteobacteria bacterium]